MKTILAFCKREPVLSIAALAALITCFFTPPSMEYMGYIDFRTLALLYALMVAVAVLRKSGALDLAARKLYAAAGGARSLALLLTALCFFSSMVLTNDVALLTFVPFAALVLRLSRAEELLLGVVVLQTLAANLGSMLTPVGNPQNLYLYSFYNMSAGEFFAATAPATIASGVLIAALVLFIPKKSIPVACFADKVKLEKKSFALSLVLLAVSLATVFRLLDWQWMLAAVVMLLLVFDRGSLRDADFLLLLTFVCFFVFVGNLGEIEAVSLALEKALAGRELLVSAAVINNRNSRISSRKEWRALKKQAKEAKQKNKEIRAQNIQRKKDAEAYKKSAEYLAAVKAFEDVKSENKRKRELSEQWHRAWFEACKKQWRTMDFLVQPYLDNEFAVIAKMAKNRMGVWEIPASFLNEM